VSEALEILFSLHDIETVSAETPDEGLTLLDGNGFDLVIQDMNFSADTTSGEEGVTLFHRIREKQPDLPVILLTAWTNLKTAVDLVKAGAADYLAKPWDDARLITTVRNLLELGELSRETREVHRKRRARREQLNEKFHLDGL